VSGLTPFLGTATGDPRRFQRRLAAQPNPNIPAITGFMDFLSAGGPISVAPKPVQRLAVRASAMRLQPLKGPIDLPDPTLAMGDANPGDPAQLFLCGNLLQGVDTTNPGSAEAFLHTISQTGATPIDQQFTLLDDDNTGLISRYHSGMVKGMALSAKPGSNLDISFPSVFGKFDHHGIPTQTAGTGGTAPELRMSTVGSLAAASAGTDEDLYVKFPAIISAGAVGALVKQGAAASYGTVPISIPVGAWTYLYNTVDSSQVGNYAEQAQLYVPTGATIVAGDIWKFPALRSRWSPTFPIDRSIPLVNCRCFFGGIELPLDLGWDLTVALADVKRLPGQGEQALGTLRSGEEVVTVKLSRTLVDMALQLGLRAQAPASLVFECFSDVKIGSTTLNYGYVFIFPQLLATGNTYAPPVGANTRTESVEYQAGVADTPLSYRTVSYSQDMVILAYSDVSAIAS
jgi:hypothetical protein